jgi:hypothetical protein
MKLDALIRFFHDLTPESIACFPQFYAEDAYFKDPFNEVRGVPAIQRVFSRLLRLVAEPCFVVTERVVDAGGAMLVWEFHYRLRFWQCGGQRVMRGVSHLKFDAEGRVSYQRDYWDSAEELYMQLPGLGGVVRGLRSVLAA